MEQRTGAQRYAQSGAHAEQVALTAQALYWLELIFGGFKRVQLKGDISETIFQMLQSHRAEQSPFADSISRKDSASDSRLIMLDRDLDYVSVLCTQVSYGGIIEEIFGSPEAASEFIQSEGCCELSFTVADPVWGETQDENLDNARHKVIERIKSLAGPSHYSLHTLFAAHATHYTRFARYSLLTIHSLLARS